MISTCICDDDCEAGASLGQMVSRYFVQHGVPYQTKIYADSSLLLSEIEHGIMFQLYILDILMPLTSGMELADAIRRHDDKAAIIFLTSSPEYAIESYDYHAENYLLKPLSYEKLSAALDRLSQRKVFEPEQALLIKKGNSVRSIALDTICCLEAFRNKSTLTLHDHSILDVYMSFSELETLLGGYRQFIRIHRSYIINMDYIREISNEKVTLSTGQKVPISSTYTADAKAAYFAYMEQLSEC